MNTKRVLYRPTRLMAGMLALSILFAVIGGSYRIAQGTSAAADAAFLTEYKIPTPNSEPLNIVTTGPREVWFTMPGADAVGSLKVKPDGTYTFAKFDTPTVDSEPFDLAYDGTFIWFSERKANKIGKLNPANGQITEYPIPTANSQPSGIAIAPNGDVWFVQRQGNKLARLKPANGAITEYPYVAPGGLLEDVAVANDDSIWLTAPGLKSAANFKPSRGEFEIVPVLDFGLPPWEPGQIAVTSDSIPWITGPSKDIVGRFAPGTLGYWRWYSLRYTDTGVNGLFLERPQGFYRAWYTETNGNRAGLLLTSRATGQVLALFEQPLPGNNPRPFGITADSEGNVWIAAPGTNTIIRWSPPYYFGSALPVTVAQ